VNRSVAAIFLCCDAEITQRWRRTVDKDSMRHRFDFQKLDVYKKALDFLSICEEVMNGLRGIGGHLADQLDRASTSICLNIAEGAGEFSRKEKARFYRMARRSATESAGIFDVLERRRRIDHHVYDTGQDVLLEVVRMLTRLSRNLEQTSGCPEA
jgi:four helix bundle protein